MSKRFIAADDLLRDSFQLAANIEAAGFHPDFLVGLWRGGSGVGIAVQEGLDFLGIKTDHIAIRTSYRGAPSYDEMVKAYGSVENFIRDGLGLGDQELDRLGDELLE